MNRTLNLVKQYEGPHDATLLLNCLLGLLIVPKETSADRIPLDPLADLAKWGISPKSIISAGNQNLSNRYPETLRGIVHNLRNSVAHFRFKPLHKDEVVIGFEFKDENGFKAVIDIPEMRIFVEKLAEFLSRDGSG